MLERILHTRPDDGGVTLTSVSPWALTMLSEGGFYNDFPRGFADTQIERFVKAGVPQFAADNFVDAMARGGKSYAEAMAIIRDKDCYKGTAHEIVNLYDLPDFWFRGAWMRSHNGGPISIDLSKAKSIHFKRLMWVLDAQEKQAAEDISAAPMVPVNREQYRSKILRCTSCDDIKKIWINRD